MTTTADHDPILKLRDIELLYGFPRAALLSLIHAGKGPPIMRWGRERNSHFLVATSDFEQWLNSMKTIFPERRAKTVRVDNTNEASAHDDGGGN